MINVPSSRRVSRQPVIGKSCSVVRQAAVTTIESMEPRLFMHAGHPHLQPVATFPNNGAQQVAVGSNLTIQFDTDIDTTTLNSTNFELRDGSNNLIPAAVTYNVANRTATLNPNVDMAAGNNYYYARVKGNDSGVKNTLGYTLDGDVNWAFTTGTPQFTEQTVISGLEGPVAVEFAKDGRIFIAERSGLIKVYDNLTDTTPTVFADLRTQVHNFWDRGLLGMALHPNFPSTPYVYVLYTYDGNIGGPAPKYGTAGVSSDPGPDATGSGALVSGRLSRLTVSNNGAGNTMVAGSELVLIHDWAQQFPSHSIGSIAFGPDGALYASAGDGASFNYADYGQTGNPFNDPANEGGALRSQDLRSPGDPTTLDGTIIRINPDTGAALSDNPLFLSGNDANAKRIIADGLRNPFRFTFRPGTNEIWAGDVGWGTWEEINRLIPSTTSTTNFGWPAYEGAERQSGYDALNLPLLESLYAAGPGAVTAPYFAYRHADKVVTGSAEPTGGSSVAGVAFYNGGTYPSAFDGALFFADYSRKAIYVMYRGLNGLPNPATRQVFKLGGVGPVQLVTGPGGDLFYVDLQNLALKRFTYAATNLPPTAVITTDKTNGAAPLTVAFSGANSTDPNPGETLSYAWDLDNDGAFDDSTLVNPTYTFSTAGTYTVRLRVTDRAGQSGTASIAITAGNTAPTAIINSPTSSLTWKVGDVIGFSGSATDPQQGTLPAANLKWSLILRHENLIDPANYHEHLIQEFNGVASGSFIAPDHEYPSTIELRLTATDAGGLTNTRTLVLQPQTTTLNFASNIPGAQLSVNGATRTAPFSQTFIVGSTNSISAPAQTINGTAYNFSNWSDSGASTHQIVAGNAGGTYTARFVPATVLPTGWDQGDIGATGLAGSASFTNNTFTVRGAGADVWGTSDSFRYVYRQVTGDTEIIARVVSLQNTHPNAKAGVQFRSSLAADATNVQVDVEGSGDWGEYHVRSVAGGQTATANFINISTPYWLRLVRQGSTFSAYRSVDGTNWILAGQDTVAMGATAYVGLAVCSHDVNLLNTAEFDNVTVRALSSNAAPQITSPAAATLAATGRTANVSVAATDDTGESTLTYTWSKASGPGGVSFAPNSTNGSKSSIATFTLTGSYVLRVTVTDSSGLSATSDITVNVGQILNDVAVSPPLVSLIPSQAQQFAAIARDQFGSAMSAQPTFTWSIDSGGVGTVSSTGLYTAPSTAPGSAAIRATAAGKSGAATVSIVGSQSDVTAGLSNRWMFDENTGTSTADSVGGNTGTLTGGTGWTPGRTASGVSFDGIDDFVGTASALSTTLGGTATLTAWIRTTQVGSANFWSSPGITGVEKFWDDNDVFWGYLDSAGRVSVKAGDDAAATSSAPINDGTWRHVAFTRDAGTGALQVFVDGVLSGSATGRLGTVTTPFNSIGRIENTNGPAAFLQGALDDVRIYNRVLTAQEVVAVRAAGSNTAPTVSSPAVASPTAPVVGVPTALTTLGADNGGEANLTYTWSVVTAPAGATVTFGANGTNAAKNSAATVSAAGAYALRVTISDGSLSTTSQVSLTAAVFGTVRVNFQPAAAATVSGYLVDAGNTYGIRDASNSFGWNTSHTANVFDRNINASQLLDTVARLKAGAVWEMAVPSGQYSVKVGIGDASSASTNTIRIEGVSVYAGTANAANVFRNATTSVRVTDGRLTLDNNTAAANLTALNYIEVTRTGN